MSTSKATVPKKPEGKKERKLNRISIRDKLKVIEKLEAGISNKVISEMFGISRGQVSDIKRQATVIKAFAKQFQEENNDIGIRKRSKQFRFDSTLYSWYIRQKVKNVTVHQKDFLATAEKIKQQLGVTGMDCNESWLDRYRERHNIQDSDIELGVASSASASSSAAAAATQLENESIPYEENNEREEDSLSHFETVVKEEVEMGDGTEWEYHPSASEGDATDQQGDEDDESMLSMSVISAMEAARRGIDDVIKYIGLTPNRALWAQYEQLRVTRELIIGDQKKSQNNTTERKTVFSNPEN